MSSRNNIFPEYVYDDAEEVIECEYVYEQESRARKSNSIKLPPQENNKPKHKTNESGVYDELDYDLYPRNANHTTKNDRRVDENARKDSEAPKRYFKKKKVIITIAILTACVFGAVIALLIFVPTSKNIFYFHYDSLLS